MVHFEQWEGFEGRIWREEVNVRDFIQKNYKPYAGDESFLAGPTQATDKLWGILQKLQKEERAKGGVLDMETHVVSRPDRLRPRLHQRSRQGLGTDCGSSDRQAAQARVHAVRRHQDGGGSLQELRL